MSYRLDVNVRTIRVAMTDVRYEGHYDQVEVYMSIVSVVETIGIEGEGIFPLKVTDAYISPEKHDRCQIFSLS
jgi:hypothetical protein